MSDLILAFDTSGAHCAACLLRGSDILEARAEEMTRGQAERLMPMLAEMLAGQSLDWGDVGHVAVGTGPGNFTGIRIAVSAARGLALGGKLVATGVTTFEALRADRSVPVAVPGPRETAYLSQIGAPARVIPVAEVPSDALWPPTDAAKLAIQIARYAGLHPANPSDPPKAFYMRPADAAPARDAPPVILDDA